MAAQSISLKLVVKPAFWSSIITSSPCGKPGIAAAVTSSPSVSLTPSTAPAAISTRATQEAPAASSR